MVKKFEENSLSVKVHRGYIMLVLAMVLQEVVGVEAGASWGEAGCLAPSGVGRRCRADRSLLCDGLGRALGFEARPWRVAGLQLLAHERAWEEGVAGTLMEVGCPWGS